MKTIAGKSKNEIDPFEEERKKIYFSLLNEIMISSYRYYNDFSKFMIGLNSALLTAYIAFLKIADITLSFITVLPFILQVTTIIFYLITIYPRSYKNMDQEKPLIFHPDVIMDVYKNNKSKKQVWNVCGSLSFVLYLISIIFSIFRII